MKVGKGTCTSQRIPVNEEACPTTHVWEVLASCSEPYGASFTSPHSMFSTPAPLCPWQQGRGLSYLSQEDPKAGAGSAKKLCMPSVGKHLNSTQARVQEQLLLKAVAKPS